MGAANTRIHVAGALRTGYAARARKNFYEVAITEMKQAISEAPDPGPMVQTCRSI